MDTPLAGNQLSAQQSVGLSDFERVTSGSINESANRKNTEEPMASGEFLAARGS